MRSATSETRSFSLSILSSITLSVNSILALSGALFPFIASISSAVLIISSNARFEDSISMNARETSAHSSATFWAIRLTFHWSAFAVEDISGFAVFLSMIICSSSWRTRDQRGRSLGLPATSPVIRSTLLRKHVLQPSMWHAHIPFTFTRYTSVSLSQSVNISRISSVSQDVSHLVQSSLRLRDQNVASPVFRVSSSARGLVNQTIMIAQVSISWAIVGMRFSGYFAKSSVRFLLFKVFIYCKVKSYRNDSDSCSPVCMSLISIVPSRLSNTIHDALILFAYSRDFLIFVGVTPVITE